MSILYCAILTKNDSILLAESTTGISYLLRLSSYIKDILKAAATGKIIMEKDTAIHYIRAKNVIFAVLTNISIEEDKPIRFMEYLVDITLSEFKTFENITNVSGKIIKYQHQQRLVDRLNKLVRSFDTHLYDKKKVEGIQLDIDETKKYLKIGIKKALQNNDDLGEFLIKTENIERKAEEFENNAGVLRDENRCIKPWMIFVAVLAVLILAYLIVALVRCNSIYNVWC